MTATIHELIDAHLRSVETMIRRGAPSGSATVDVVAQSRSLRRDAHIFIRCGYDARELTLLPDSEIWWTVQVVPLSVVKPADQPPGTRP